MKLAKQQHGSLVFFGELDPQNGGPPWAFPTKMGTWSVHDPLEMGPFVCAVTPFLSWRLQARGTNSVLFQVRIQGTSTNPAQPKLGPPVVPFSPFFGGGFPY